ncbi:hypothetical protein [Acinetobacter sp. Ac_5812]|uniref:hypothetical protein n=1 Tax=Acinetobacter sp. Ac_5812 TaxID=1848937 RepID=UPI0014900E03|nr:hypothetical protein [Acinetobacter sp. Ac_5812]NNP70967.1 hypothetical protein [Acinetobacter sp. Ac_5812]
MNIDKEREAFEALPLAKLALDQDWVRYSEDTNSYYPNEDFCPDSAPESMNFAWESWQASAIHAEAKLEGSVVVPVEPTEDQWGGLARILGRYMQNKDRYCPKTLKRHLDMFADEIPEWLNKEVPNWESEHAFATADLPVFIYKAMVEAARGGNE